MAEATQAWKKTLKIEQVFNACLAVLEACSGTQCGQLAVNTQVNTTSTAGQNISWDDLSPIEQERLFSQVVDHLDIEKVTRSVAAKLGFGTVKGQVGVCLGKIEHEFVLEHGAINKLQEQMATWDAQRNTTSSE